MNTAKQLNFTRKDENILFILSSTFLIIFLFSLDIGYNNSRIFQGAFAWVLFLIYFIPTLAGQFMISKFLSNVDNGSGKTLISMLLGAMLGMIAVVGITNIMS